jgi:methionyl-tRNA formyltransferase
MKKSRAAGLYLLENCWQALLSGKVTPTPQDESKSRYFSLDDDPPETIDWSKSNVEIHNLIRASALPFAGVHTFWNGRKLIFRKSAPLKNSSDNSPGTVLKTDENGVEIATGNGNLLVTAIEIDDELLTPEKLKEIGLEPGNRFQ